MNSRAEAVMLVGFGACLIGFGAYLLVVAAALAWKLGATIGLWG